MFRNKGNNKGNGMRMYRLGIWQLTLTGILTAVLLGMQPRSSFAQEQEVAAAGRAHYERNCGACHGAEGKGDGVVAKLLTTKPSDLTQLSKKSGGVFPFWHVYDVIDGRQEVKGHGKRKMPIWGEVFHTQAAESPFTESVVLGRILEVVYYLQSIQGE